MKGFIETPYKMVYFANIVIYLLVCYVTNVPDTESQ